MRYRTFCSSIIAFGGQEPLTPPPSHSLVCRLFLTGDFQIRRHGLKNLDVKLLLNTANVFIKGAEDADQVFYAFHLQFVQSFVLSPSNNSAGRCRAIISRQA